MERGVILILFLFLFCVFLTRQRIKHERHSLDIVISRSRPKNYTSSCIECGNCRGTGLDGFGIMPDSFKCEGCNDRGYYKIDPNTKSMSLKEIIEKYKLEDN